MGGGGVGLVPGGGSRGASLGGLGMRAMSVSSSPKKCSLSSPVPAFSSSIVAHRYFRVAL